MTRLKLETPQTTPGRNEAPHPSPGGSARPVRPGRSGRSGRRVAFWIATAVIVGFVVLAVVLATRPPVQAFQADSPLLGRLAPQFSGTTFNGGTVKLSQFKGRYVFVNFFASWCPACQSEEPNLVAFNFQQQETPNGAALVSVDFRDYLASARQFVATYGARWPAISDPGGKIANAYGVGSPPTTFLINPKGVVVTVLVGPLDVKQLDASLSFARSHSSGG